MSPEHVPGTVQGPVWADSHSKAVGTACPREVHVGQHGGGIRAKKSQTSAQSCSGDASVRAVMHALTHFVRQ